jgi:MFS family permease
VANAVVIAGLSVGLTATPPLISWLMPSIGWRESFYVTSTLAFLLAVCWGWYATDHPEIHARVRPQDLAVVRRNQCTADGNGSNPGSWRRLLSNRNMILISLSYFLRRLRALHVRLLVLHISG